MSRSSVPCLRKTLPALWVGEIPWPSAQPAPDQASTVANGLSARGRQHGAGGVHGAGIVGALRTVGDDGASLRANFELNQAQPHGRRMSQRHCVRAKAWRCFTSSATYLITAVNGAASGTFTLRASTDSGAVRQLATRRVAVAQSTAQAGATHTRNGSFGSEARIILNFTFSPPPAFGGISARLRRVAFGPRRGATVPAALPLAAGR